MQYLSIGDLLLESGQVLPEVIVAYETFGRLDPDGANAVLVTHGLTSGTDMLTPSKLTGEGSWSDLLGPGHALDSQLYFTICSNVIGSCLGSTGPASKRPGSDTHWGPDFPALTVSDMVKAQHALLRALGVTKLQCVLGPSYGGMQALQWAIDQPEWVRSIGVIVSGLSWPEAMRPEPLRQRLAADPTWKHGWYSLGVDLIQTMASLRHETLESYGVRQLLEKRWPDQPERIEHALDAASQVWGRQFDANALLTLQAAGEQFDVRNRLREIRCPVLFVPSRTDLIFPPVPQDREPMLEAWPDLTYLELDTPYGHSASGAELGQWEPALHDLLAQARHASRLSSRDSIEAPQ